MFYLLVLIVFVGAEDIEGSGEVEDNENQLQEDQSQEDQLQENQLQENQLQENQLQENRKPDLFLPLFQLHHPWFPHPMAKREDLEMDTRNSLRKPMMIRKRQARKPLLFKRNSSGEKPKPNSGKKVLRKPFLTLRKNEDYIDEYKFKSAKRRPQYSSRQKVIQDYDGEHRKIIFPDDEEDVPLARTYNAIFESSNLPLQNQVEPKNPNRKARKPLLI